MCLSMSLKHYFIPQNSGWEMTVGNCTVWYLHVSIDEPIQFEIFVVIAEGVDQLFGNLQHSESASLNWLILVQGFSP